MPQTYIQPNRLSEFAVNKSIVVTPHDSDTIPLTGGLFVQGAGDIVVGFADGTTDTWTVPAFWSYRLSVVRVLSTGTTATGIKALY
jgi:hypothetical protein